MSTSKNKANAKILESNPGVDKNIVERFEELRKQLESIVPPPSGATYNLDLPTGREQLIQPALTNIAKRRLAV